jgi:hypothetical protein
MRKEAESVRRVLGAGKASPHHAREGALHEGGDRLRPVGHDQRKRCLAVELAVRVLEHGLLSLDDAFGLLLATRGDCVGAVEIVDATGRAT